MKITRTKYKRFSKEGIIAKLLTGKYAFIFGFLFCSCISGYIILSVSDASRHATYHPKLSNNKILNQIYGLAEKLHTLDLKNNETHTRPSDQYEQNTVIAEMLAKEVKILCWVMTNPANHQSKAKSVKETWGKRCNKLLFMSTELDAELDTVALNVEEGRDFLWAKTKEAFRYVYRYHLDDYDWFYKADDDTYTVVENMRYMLHAYSPNMPVYFGCKFKPYVKQGYMSGGAGYVLSREALRRFAEQGIHDEHKCKSDDHGVEDMEMGICMENLNVTAGDSRDALQRGKFFYGSVDYALFPSNDGDDWTSEYRYYKMEKGFECCSNNAISFHYIAPHDMYVYEYLIYNLQPFGVMNLPQTLPKMVSFEYVAEMNKATTISTQVLNKTLADTNTTGSAVEEGIDREDNDTMVTIEDTRDSPSPPIETVTLETFNVSSTVSNEN